LWGPVRRRRGDEAADVSTLRLLVDSAIGILACLCIVLATNGLFVADWWTLAASSSAALVLSATLIFRVLGKPALNVSCSMSDPAGQPSGAPEPNPLLSHS
jgi:hypothetical protein